MTKKQKQCIELGCNEVAGTPWTDHWCLKHDEERREKIDRQFEELFKGFD